MSPIRHQASQVDKAAKVPCSNRRFRVHNSVIWWMKVDDFFYKLNNCVVCACKIWRRIRFHEKEQEQPSDLRPYANNSIRCCQKEKILRGWVDIFHLFAPPCLQSGNNRSIAKSHESKAKKILSRNHWLALISLSALMRMNLFVDKKPRNLELFPWLKTCRLQGNFWTCQIQNLRTFFLQSCREFFEQINGIFFSK